jgi:hypothetical protein
MKLFGPPRARLACTRAGHTLVVHSKDAGAGALSGFGARCAVEPGHTVVAVDVRSEPPEAFEDVLDDLAAAPGVLRLVPVRMGFGSHLDYGRFLAERLHRPVLAHEGRVGLAAGGGMYVVPGPNEGVGWVRFDPDHAPRAHSRRFPRPRWDCAPFGEPCRLDSHTVFEPLPAGGWIRPDHDSPDLLSFRRWLLGYLAPDMRLPRIVIGYPDSASVPLSAVARFWDVLPEALRPAVRFSRFGRVDQVGDAWFGQALADALDAHVIVSDGVRLAASATARADHTRVFLPEGAMTWPRFVEDVRYLPVRSTGGVPLDPVPVARRHPIKGLREREREPGVYDYSEDAVLEVTRSGLWLRPSGAAAEGARVRAEPANPGHAKVAYDSSSHATAQRMALLADEVVARLEPQVRSVARIVPAGGAERTPGYASPAVPEPDPERVVPGISPAVSVTEAPATYASTAAPADASLASDDRLVPDLARVAQILSADAARAGESPAAQSDPLADTRLLPRTDRARRRTAEQISIVNAANRTPDEQSVPASPATPAHAPRSAPQEAGEPIEYAAFQLVSSLAEPVGASPTSPDRPAASAATSTPLPVAPAAPASAPAPAQNRKPATTAPAAGGRPARSAPRVQPVPTAQTCAIVWDGGIDKERAWLRRNLSRQYDATASSVARILSEYPGLRAGASAANADVLTDLVALRLYLTGQTPGLDEAVRAAKVGPHVPMARCIAAGLRRLPSYRGPLRTRAHVTDEQLQWYAARSLITEWSFLPALASGAVALSGTTDILVWSMTARRTELVDPSRRDQAVFLPGTSFKVLGIGGEIRMRELARTEVAADGTVHSLAALDDAALEGLEAAARTWRGADPAEELPAGQEQRFAATPGLIAPRAAGLAARSREEGGKP